MLGLLNSYSIKPNDPKLKGKIKSALPDKMLVLGIIENKLGGCFFPVSSPSKGSDLAGPYPYHFPNPTGLSLPLLNLTST